MSKVIKDGDSENQSLATDALPMSPRELPEESSQIPLHSQPEENVEEPTSTGNHSQPTESQMNLPNTPTDWNFNIFLNNIAENLTTEDLATMKFLFEGPGGIGKGVLEKMKTPKDLFRLMKNEGYISRDNLLYLQGMLYHIGRKDLIQDGIDYAKTLGNVLHFYAPTFLPENGYKYVKFHVDGYNFQTYSRADIEKLRSHVSALLFVPPQFVFVAGIEPSSSLVITLMIPELYVLMLKEMLEAGDVLTALSGTGVDVIDIDGEKSYDINSTEPGESDTVKSEQHMKLVNVYDQLQKTKERLENSEMTCIDLYSQIDEMQKEIEETKENLTKMENEVHALEKVLSKSEDGKQPASLKGLSSLTEFKESLHHLNKLNIDKKIVRRMIDSTVNIVSTRVREFHKIREQSLTLSLQDMQTQLEPLMFELERYKFLDSLSHIDQTVLDKLQAIFQPVIGQVQVSLTPLGVQMVKKIYSKLRYREKEKLKQKYQWTPNGDIEKFMDQNQNLFLAGLFYKEMETKKMHVNLETFLAQCLSEVGRDDLKKFLDPEHFLSPQGSQSFADVKQQAYHQQQKQHQQGLNQDLGKQQQEQANVINRMALQIEEMYKMLQTTKQKMFEPKFDDWKTPTFPFTSNFYQQKQSS